MPDKPQEHDAPQAQTVAEPIVEMEETGHAHFTGNRGNSGNNNILQSDASGSECCIIQSKTGNVFLEAAGSLQSESSFRIEEVKGDKVLFTQSYTMNNTGTVDTYVAGNTTYNENADFTLNVVGTHTENVNIQAINAQSQTVNVSGAQDVSVVADRTIKVGGKVVEEVGGDKVRDVTGSSTCKILGDTINNFLGKHEWIKASTDRGLTISEKEQINIAGEISLNVGASEKVNVGAHAEQTFAKKNSLTMGFVTDIAFGTKKSIDYSTTKNKTALLREVATKIKNDKYTMGKTACKLHKFGAKLCMFS